VPIDSQSIGTDEIFDWPVEFPYVKWVINARSALQSHVQ
jgi:hypothetical protein